MTIPPLSDYEYQFDDDGVLLNPETADVTASLPFIDVSDVKGLDSPDFRTTTRSHEGVDGGYVDSEFMEMRTITIEAILYADPTDPDTICDALRYNFRPTADERPFYFKHPNKSPRVVFGKGQGARYDVDTLRREGKTSLQCTIICPTPYIYDADEIVGTGSLGGIDTGHGFNHGFNMGFGGNNNYNGDVDVFNAGNHNAYPFITIFGPIAGPGLSDSSTGKRVEFDLTLAATDYLEVDFRRHRVTLNGTTSMRHTLISGPRSWWSIAPGSSTIKLTGSQGSGTGSATEVVGGVSASYLECTDADASDILVNDRCHLYDSTGLLKETTVFTVTSKTAGAAGQTRINFTPSAAANLAIGDVLRAGNATFQVNMRSTYY